MYNDLKPAPGIRPAGKKGTDDLCSVNVHLMHWRQAEGFTLIEIIVSIVVAAILGTMFVQFVSTTGLRTVNPVTWLKDETEISSDMEEIISVYTKYINTSPPTPIKNIKTYLENLLFDSSVSMELGSFDNGTWDDDSSGKNLKVTVHKQGHKLTTILAETRSSGDEAVAY